MPDTAIAVERPKISEERLACIRAACFLRDFVNTVTDGDYDNVSCADAIDYAEKMKLAAPDMRQGIGSSDDLKTLLKQSIAQRGSNIVKRDMNVWKIDAKEATAKLTSHLMDHVGLPRHQSIFYIDDLSALSAIDEELSRLVDEMQIKRLQSQIYVGFGDNFNGLY